MSDGKKTDTFDRLKQFNESCDEQKFEWLFFQLERLKSVLESEGVVKDLRHFCDIMNGTTEKAGLPVRVEWIESQIKKLVSSNAKLQAAMYICTGAYIAVKFYFDVFHNVP